MKFSVTVLHRARADADCIFAWIATHSAQGAAQWGRKYDEAIATLSRDADQHSIAPESAETGISVRQKLFKTRRGHPYRLLYTIDGHEVRILRVRGPGQAPITAKDLQQ